MIDIICLKWGKKFSHTFVNELYDMVEKNFKKDFNFICYTDDQSGIYSNIITIPLALEYDFKGWWWKMTLFEEPRNNTTIFLDLDIVIQNDITHLADLAQENKLRTIKCYWKDYLKDDIAAGVDHDLNSSVIIWKGDLSAIWEDFLDNENEYVEKYRGIDSVLYFHHFNKLLWISPGEIYSRLYGIDKDRFMASASLTGSSRETLSNLFYDESYNICIFNGYKEKQINSVRQSVKPGGLKEFFDDRAYKDFQQYVVREHRLLWIRD